jgi:lysophospholipid acyltransferase (LPLAT)-like uncharacterized protein
MLKTLLSSAFVQTLIGRSLGLYARVTGWTTRWRIADADAIAPLWAQNTPLILCFWHGRILQAHVGWPKALRGRLKMLVSQSRDGSFIAHVAASVSGEPIRGSSSHKGQDRGGREAMFSMARHLKTGGHIGLTPDGPKGPRMRAQLGAIQLAKLSGAALVPAGWATSHAVVADSWDKAMFPLPFGRGAYVFGAPIFVPRETDAAGAEALRVQLEAEMIRVTQVADQMIGRAPTPPAPLPESINA